MKRPFAVDPFFYDQPEKKFLEELKKPVHTKKPSFFGTRKVMRGETDASGMYLKRGFPNEEGLLDAVYNDFDRFLSIHEIGGTRYPIYLEKRDVGPFESFSILVSESKAVISANDTEGIRRAIIYLEDELIRREGAYLPIGEISRSPVIKTRITRCFFSPINRPPKYGDELSDDIDYYPEEYLNRLMHDGANGVWIYTRFSDLVTVDAVPDYGIGREKRIKKLNRVIEKCLRYGIKAYVFAIEPVALEPERSAHIKEADGGEAYNGNHLFCVNSPEGKEMIRQAGYNLFTSCPKLGGFISITYGERPTSCSSAYSAIPEIGYKTDITCPRCKELSPGQMVANAAHALSCGIHEASPDAQVISWTYGHRFWPIDDVKEYVRCATHDAVIMQNFEEMGYAQQLGKTRQGVDYWLSYVGPSPLFKETALEAIEQGKEMFMKIQVCCSHEVATVPYVPVPGILFDKYQAARKLNVTGVMQCWYFGNYPSIMSKAAGELAFLSDFSDKDGFLKKLAGIYFGSSNAEKAVKAWNAFEKAYTQYPLNIMFSYYGPMHDGPVWELQLLPKNYPLSRSWQTLDPTIGDRIGESLLSGHSLDEAITLTDRMKEGWAEGTKLLERISTGDEAYLEQLSVAKALDILFSSGNNILRFYSLRESLGCQKGDPKAILKKMRAIIADEIKNSNALKALCLKDSRLGYHSEGEGFKFFPKKLDHRISQLNSLLEIEFPQVEKRINDGLAPLTYYLGEEAQGAVYSLKKSDIASAKWESIGEDASFRAAYSENTLEAELISDTAQYIDIGFEFSLMWPAPPVRLHRDGKVEILPETYLYFSVFGDTLEDVKKLWRVQSLSDNKLHLLISLEREKTGWTSDTPLKLRIVTDSGISWAKDDDPVHTLGKNSASPGEFGWLLPETKGLL